MQASPRVQRWGHCSKALLFIADLPESVNILTATFADNTAFLTLDRDPGTALSVLQSHINKIHAKNNCRIKASTAKSNHITFSLRILDCPTVKLDEDVPYNTVIKYVGFYLYCRKT